MTHIFDFGRIAYAGAKRRTHGVTVSLELRETPQGPELSIQGCITDPQGVAVSAGQNLDTIAHYIHTPTFKQLYALWERWHLNGLNAGCIHQDAWDTNAVIEMVTYEVTPESSQERHQLKRQAAIRLASGQMVAYTDAELVSVNRPYRIIRGSEFPHPGAPYVEKRREKKLPVSVTPAEHPRGILGKPCEICGYEYGTAWNRAPLPESVLRTIESLTTAEPLR